jgi:cytochrome c oxidase assembly factor CtaG
MAPPTSADLASAWNPEPLVIAAAAVGSLLFARALTRLRRRGRTDLAGGGRALLFAGGIALVVLPLVSPLDAAGDRDLLAAHMLEHVLVGDAGPALLVLAVRGPLLAFAVPVPVIRFANTRLRRVLGTLRRPVAAATVWTAAIGAWHVPWAYDAALGRPWLHALEHGTYLGAGLLIWVVLIDPARSGRVSIGARAGLAGAVFAAGQILCGVLFLSTEPLYPAYAGGGAHLFGIGPLADQQYAGLVMMAEQLLTLGTFVAILALSALRRQSRASGKPWVISDVPSATRQSIS